MLQRVSLQDARQTRNCWLIHTCVLALTSLSGLNSKTTNRHHEYWGYPEKTLQTRLSPSALLFASAIKTNLMTSRFRFCVQLIRQTFPPLAMWVIETICTISALQLHFCHLYCSAVQLHYDKCSQQCSNPEKPTFSVSCRSESESKEASCRTKINVSKTCLLTFLSHRKIFICNGVCLQFHTNRWTSCVWGRIAI